MPDWESMELETHANDKVLTQWLSREDNRVFERQSYRQQIDRLFSISGEGWKTAGSSMCQQQKELQVSTTDSSLHQVAGSVALVKKEHKRQILGPGSKKPRGGQSVFFSWQCL